MGKNKTGKYLKYAIGEIVLVVIGILLALQINQWYANRHDKQQEQFYIKKLVQNIAQDTTYLKRRNGELDTAAIRLKEFQNEIQSITYNEFTIDSIALALVGIYRFSPQTSTMDNLISTGKLNLIRNQTLVDSLFVYYNDLNNYPSQRNASDESYSRMTIGPKLMQMPGGIMNLQKVKLTQSDSIFILNAIEFKNKAIRGLKKDYTFSLNRAKRIIDLLEEEIQTDHD